MNFEDRKPQYPGRVKLVKVAGSTDLYDLTPAEGSVTGSYREGTPLNAATLNAFQNEINNTINNKFNSVSQSNQQLNSIRLYDGSNYGTKLTIGTQKDITVRLPTTIMASFKGNVTGDLTGTADSAKSITSNYGKITMKSVSLSTSYTTVYTASKYSSIVLILSPYSGNAKNTAVFAASYADGKTSINDLNYVNKSGYINKRWSGQNFQISMSSSNAVGTYALTIIEARY